MWRVNRFSFLTGMVTIGLNATVADAANWPSWRGNLDGSGITPETGLPVNWDRNQNIRWRVPLPDRGNSSPIVWGDKVFITQPIEKEHRRTVMCFQRGDGRLLWQNGVTYAKPEETHKTNPYCSGSPVTDGRHVVANFASAGLFCYDVDGNELWRRDFGPQQHIWGNGTSPILFRDLCILYHGPGQHSMLYCLDKLTGKTLWKRKVEEPNQPDRQDGFRGQDGGINGAFSTPIVIRFGGRDELILSEAGTLRALNPRTGEELWHCHGLNPLIYTSPVYGEGLVVSMGGYMGASIAVKPGGSGNVTSRRIWRNERSKKNRLGTGVIREGYVYLVNMSGFFECVNLKTGRQLWSERLSASLSNPASWASPILSGDKIYVTNQSGDTHILRPREVPDCIDAGPSADATPAEGRRAAQEREARSETHVDAYAVR